MNNINENQEIWGIESEEDAKHLIDKLGIPKSKEQLEYILKQGTDTRDSCLLTYASMLCEQTPQGNEHVDKLITLSMQHCKPEHLASIIADYRSISDGMHSANESRFNKSTVTGLAGKEWHGKQTSRGQFPLNFERRKRLMLAIYKGMIRNPNVKIEQMTSFLSAGSFDYDKDNPDPVTKEFIANQFKELQIALVKGECTFTTKELKAGAQQYIGITPEELEEGLDSAETRQAQTNGKLTLQQLGEGTRDNFAHKTGAAIDAIHAVETGVRGIRETNEKRQFQGEK